MALLVIRAPLLVVELLSVAVNQSLFAADALAEVGSRLKTW